MAAGLGFKTFVTGDVLTASDTNGYLMQGVLVFASAAARSAAITSPQEGQCSYLKDTNAVEVYDGANWVSSDDPNAIQNTIVDAKGDLIGASAADTPARLAVGANGTILVADSAESTGLKWARTGNFTGCRVYASSAQTISNATDTKLAFANETYDTDGFHSNVANNTRITIPAGLGGYYRITANSGFLTNASGRRIMGLTLNGSGVASQIETTANASAEPTASITDIYSLAAADYLEVNVYQTSGGNLNTTGSAAREFFQVERIGS